MSRNPSRVFMVVCGLLLALCGVPAAAALELDVPARVARGDAFLVTARTDTAADALAFRWRGKTHTVPVMLLDGVRTAWLLLPVPVDAKEQTLSLSVGLAGDKKVSRTVQAAVALYDRERPVQRLTVERKYVNPPANEQARIAEDRRKVRAVISRYTPERYWTLPLLRPVPGGVSSLFGMKRVFNGQPRSVHRGLDLRGAAGTPIRAAADGVIALVDNLYFSGNTVYINHGLGVFTAYLHMSATDVQPGQTVRRGDVIGKVGATGRVTGPHLHLSMLVQGVSVDPLPLLEQASGTTRQP
ncbi:MAG: M23 family metallopeptidase [Desulfovibrionaceae bacterium]|nr:M23 family metallopeptidase [Desulfovibrionaceae bacterium]